ncbi:MAG: NAD(P)/FAD-dependent oxidoreductase [Chloroflexia bacterium]
MSNPQSAIRNPQSYDAIVVGSGPNGLAAGITLARAGRHVLILEGHDTVGGGTRTTELTLPGFLHDICSAIHPLGVGSPFFRTLPLSRYGLRWIEPPAQVAHPLDDGTAVLLYRSVRDTAKGLGRDAPAYRLFIGSLARAWPQVERTVLGPIRFPRHPFALARFGLPALLPASLLARIAFRGERARAFFGGLAAHSMLPLTDIASAAPGRVLGIFGHCYGWPLPVGGSQSLANALAAHFRSLGGHIVTGHLVRSLDELPSAPSVLFDVSPRNLIELAGDQLPPGYKKQLGKFRYGPGVFKIDYALSGPVPWRARECSLAATIHLGGTLSEIEQSERAVWKGVPSERPFVLAAQQSLFDGTRAPAGSHTLWAYCHVPNGSTIDMTEPIEAQIERFAPGFRDLILSRHVMSPADMQAYNPNYIGGDINGGAQDLRQLFTRPLPRLDPYSTPNPRLFLCSASTPPGGGVHGLCGYHAARSVLRKTKT